MGSPCSTAGRCSPARSGSTTTGRSRTSRGSRATSTSAPGDLGYWQGSFRDPSSEEFVEALRVIREREPFAVEILYGDEEGGQRRISRFGVLARGESEWLAEAGRHWNLDRADPR